MATQKLRPSLRHNLKIKKIKKIKKNLKNAKNQKNLKYHDNNYSFTQRNFCWTKFFRAKGDLDNSIFQINLEDVAQASDCTIDDYFNDNINDYNNCNNNSFQNITDLPRLALVDSLRLCLEYLFFLKIEKRQLQKKNSSRNSRKKNKLEEIRPSASIDWDSVLKQNYFLIGQSIIRDKYELNLLQFMLQEYLRSSSEFLSWRESFCGYTLHLKKNAFHQLDTQLNRFESIIGVDGIFPNQRERKNFKLASWKNYKFKKITEEKLAIRNTRERVEQSSKELSQYLYQYYINLQQGPSFWKVFADATGKNFNLHTSVGICPIIGIIFVKLF